MIVRWRRGGAPWVALALLGWALLAFAQSLAVPELRARVTDLTGTLTASEAAALDAKLAAFETHKGSQIAVLIVPTTGEETVEQYGIRVVERWKLGRQGVDDGVLLLIAKDDRRLRIEVGYGLEGAVPDAIAKRIVSDVITPYFRRGDWYMGIAAGVDALIAVIDGEPLPEPSRDRRAAGDAAENLGVIALIAGVVIGFIVRIATNRFAGGLSALLVAGLVGAVLAGVAVALFYALFAFAVVVAAGGGGRRGRYIGGWGGGLGGGGFGGGGGGFSGGGGGFGGGGASGGW